MILVTTRFPKIVEMVTKESNPIDLRGLDPDEFWKFFQICAFGRIQDEHGDQELIGIARKIADKLKCSPLAAKTVGRLLIKKPFQELWMKILDNKEWLEENHDNDIIPALKISYDYLPFHLKKCFSCFSLFPDDYKFGKLEIIRFWDSIGIIDYPKQNKKFEDIGSDYLDELLDNGFHIKGDDNNYVMHDLLHDLSRKVSLEECAYISCSTFEANEIPQSIRYLSIFMHDDIHVKSFEEGMEMKEFHVKNASVGFELGELGKLEVLGGELKISGLENVRTSQEAEEAKLMEKRNLVKLGLVWNSKQESTGDDILDSLKPHSNIRILCIVNHGGSVGPSWLCSNIIYMRNLETLHLERVSWANLPPIGQMYHLRKLKLKNILGISQIGPDFFGGTTEKSFTHLMEVQFYDMPDLVEWVGGANCHLFSRLEKISCTGCPMLTTLLISGWPISSSEGNTKWFPSLRDLYILRCPKLCLPPMPHTSMVSSIDTDCLSYYRTTLNIWKPSELVFHNLGDVERLTIWDESCFSFMDLQKIHSLRHIYRVQTLELRQFSLTRKSLSNLFECFPALSRLDVSTSSNEDHEEVVLQFPPSSSLRNVRFVGCKNLILPVDEEEGVGFCGISSLESVAIINCNKLFSRWPMGGGGVQTQSIIYPLPPSLKKLSLEGEVSTLPMALLANLTSLTSLELFNCKDITVDGFVSLITINLEHLYVHNRRDGEAEPYSVAADLLAVVARTKTLPAGSFQLVCLYVDSISAVLVAPICSRLSATLQRLSFDCDWRTEKLTEEQDEALRLLTSLRILWFNGCRALRSLPQGLHRLPSLQELRIWGTQKIRSLPKEGLPDSLRLLDIHNCSPEIYEECQKLRGTRPDIHIHDGLTIVDNKTSNILEETKKIQIRRKHAGSSSYMPNSAVDTHTPSTPDLSPLRSAA
ncbi:unnamed protein product [Miscanthus lutarioriparius]|uniref:NB-ARC domain-containing protein n=1 Tax=Miscanthus lutarioriparius TaxID=422564 RepID=A0A811RFM1_9POAL|nr:unnamed protein product [Miscanthus lutarioriparius]